MERSDKIDSNQKNRNGLHIQVVRPLILTGPEAVNICMCVRVKCNYKPLSAPFKEKEQLNTFSRQ